MSPLFHIPKTNACRIEIEDDYIHINDKPYDAWSVTIYGKYYGAIAGRNFLKTEKDSIQLYIDEMVRHFEEQKQLKRRRGFHDV